METRSPDGSAPQRVPTPHPQQRGGEAMAASSCSERRAPGTSAQRAGSPAPQESRKDPKDMAGLQAPAQPALHLPTRSEPGHPPNSNLLRVLFSLRTSPFASARGWTCGRCSGHSCMSESGARGMVLHLELSSWSSNCCRRNTVCGAVLYKSGLCLLFRGLKTFKLVYNQKVGG